MKISFKTILIVFGVLIISVIAFTLIPADDTEDQYTDELNINYNKLNEVVFDVRTDLVKKGDLVKTITANGIVKAFIELEVIPNISGYVEEINIFNGKHVKKGEVLVRLDDKEHQINVKEAEVNVSNAKIEYGFLSKEVAQVNNTAAADSINLIVKKLENDFKEGKIDEKNYLSKKEELDLALIFTGAKRDEIMLNKSGLTNAINALNRARLNLSYTEITAPFGGVIADANLVRRQRINAGEALFKLLDLSSFKIEVGVLENEAALLKTGSRAEIQLNALPGKKYYGRVIYINPLIDAETKTCRVTIQIPNTDEHIKSGMFASVKIESEILSNRILIPREALLVRDKRNLVFITERSNQNSNHSLAKWHYVQTGEQNENYIEILDGVAAGDSVIVEGHYNLAHDAKIRIIQ